MMRLSILAVLGTFLATSVQGQIPPPPPREGAVQYEIQARGPVHEAFAAIVDGKLAATPVVAKAPPPPLNEQPPDLKPEGDDVEWIGGYWYWSEERDGYIWISGCWRDAPPGRDWLPGQWVRTRAGHHWVSGAWLPEGTTQVALLPQPPEPIEEDAGAPPTATSMFVPGTWVWKETRYAWRPGQWVEQPAEWVWQPAQYVWTPSGYLFVEGYWDQPLSERGLLYAPAAFPANVVTVNRVVYVPQYVVRPTFLEGALFARAVTKHYYFGDYFEARYQTAGFVPWYDYRTSRVAVDPIFAHYRAYQRGADWERTLRSQYAARYEGRTARPPRTWTQQQQTLGATPAAEAQRAAPLVSVQQTPANVQQVIQQVKNVTNVKVEQVTEARKTGYKEQADKRRDAAKTYQEAHTQRLAQPGAVVTPPKAPVEVKVPTLPPRAKAPQPAPQFQPMPKTGPPPMKNPPVTPPKQPPVKEPPVTQPKPPATPPKQSEQPKETGKVKKPPPAPKLPPPKEQPMKEQPKKDDKKKDGKKKDG